MKRILPRPILILSLLLGAILPPGTAALCQDSRADRLLQSPSAAVVPFAPLVRFAEKHDIPVSRIELGGENSQQRNGGCLTLVVVLSEGQSVQQWLTVIRQDSLVKSESGSSGDEVLYTSTGRELHFKSTPAALDVHFIGPFTDAGSVGEERLNEQLQTAHRVVVSREHLNIGLDRFGRTGMDFEKRCNAAGTSMKSLYHIGSASPLSSGQLEQGQKFVRIVHPTEEEERIVFSVAFALNAFMSAALGIDDFSGVVDRVLEKPSVWSVVSQFGVHRSLRYSSGDARPRDIGPLGISLPAYEQPIQLELNGNVALKATIIMTAARPPLQLCAGIVQVYAEHPGNRGSRLLIQVIAGRL